MQKFDPELVQVMRNALEEVVTKVPLEYSTSSTKAYLPECILKATAQRQKSYDQLVAAAADQIDQMQALLGTVHLKRTPGILLLRHHVVEFGVVEQKAALRRSAGNVLVAIVPTDIAPGINVPRMKLLGGTIVEAADIEYQQ